MSGGANYALFYAEMYNREFLSRLSWFEKNYEKVYEVRADETVPKKAKILYEEIVRRRLSDHQNAPRFTVPRALPPIPEPDFNVEVLPPMRPVPEAESALLAEGSEPFLKARYLTSPDRRFYFPATSSWDYGWLVQDMPLVSAASRVHGRKNIIKETFLRRSGVHPELGHYRHTAGHNRDFPFI